MGLHSSDPDTGVSTAFLLLISDEERLRRNMLRNVYILSGSRQLMTVVSGWFLIADIRAAQVLTKSEILVSMTTYSGHPFFFNA